MTRPLSLLVALALTLATRAARGEPPPPPARPAPADVAATSAPPAAATPMPGARVATGQAPVVGGNAAGARERALDEAMRQAVDMALAELADAPTRASQAPAIKAIEAKARSLVPRYRTAEEGETNGVYTVRIEAEVDEVALRRKIDRWGATSPVAAPTPAGASGLLIAAGDQAGSTSAFLASLLAALAASNVRARVDDASDLPVAAVAQAATRASLGHAALVSATVGDEGEVRGTGRVAISCRATARLFATTAGAASGAAAPERTASARVFPERAETGHAECLARLARDLGDQLRVALSASRGPGSGDLKMLTVDADVVEADAISALLKSVRSVGSVSAAELQRVGAGRAEIRVWTRAASGPLAAALSRDADARLTLTDVQTSADLIRLRARLRAPVPPAPGSGP